MPHKKCLFEGGCNLTASFGYRGFGTRFCSKHKIDDMINLVCRLCECGKARPTYNFEGKPAAYCKLCRVDGMKNVNDKPCKCGRVTPTFNLPGLKPEYCFLCKSDNMVDVASLKCSKCKKTKPSFNYKGLKPEFCGSCKNDLMIDVIHPRCKCGRAQPSHNYEGLQPEYCSKCKLPQMVMVKRRTCIVCLKEQATYNDPGKKAEYCRFCKKPDQINVVDKCKYEHCVRSGNKNYRYYCTHCFQHLFPNDPLTANIKMKTKENQVRNFLNTEYEGFIHDQPLWTGNCDCSHRRRIDHRKLFGNTLLCIETDEFQHKRYDNKDEEIRYDDLYMVHGGKFIFIRFNPDKYINSDGIVIETSIKKRLGDLKDEIDKQIERIYNEENKELVEIIYLFYDEI